MDSQLTTDGAALRLFFTDDVYLVNEPGVQHDGFGPTVDVEFEALPVQTPVADFKFLGNNKRNILILVNDEQNEVSDEAGRELLRKIVKSVNLTANDFALLNYAKYKGTGFKQLQDYFSCTLVFAFGVTPAALSLSGYPENSIVQEGAVRMIFSAELKALDQHPGGKKALWGSLQNLGL
ncbi:hypothetical protein [Pedobacter nyackensis]|uniref:Uncharacterized protein n=1 Tax=Pedobacter nyackensis TaxID=475255 RepID=A0A1W2B6E2_9SPHI|nr:hypothetical protein [Pedobacter nyackensis]SMC68573.1 hypothetical protein SAMN04488101_102175 [Pedobacter nyackensis]